jgi:hypothetical protein
MEQLYKKQDELRQAQNRICKSNGIKEPYGKKITESGAIARMEDHLWWRRNLRKTHAKIVEGSAIKLGYVNKTKELYVSDQSIVRRIQQNKRNQQTLETTIAVNEKNQEFKLAELVATSTANKAIRRAELMTRIAGFETVAKELNHSGLFITVTCPSRMHRCKTIGQAVIENKKYDGTTSSNGKKYYT